MKDQLCVPRAPSSTVDRSTGEDNIIMFNKILCMLTVTALSVLLSSSATSRTGHIGIEYMYKKGGQVTKPIIVVKIPCKLLYQKIKLSVTSVDSHIPIYNATHNQ